MQINVIDYLERETITRCWDKTAIVDGQKSYTFGDLAGLAKNCATLILAKIDVINQPIAVYLGKSANTVFADLGIVYSGNVYTNLDVKSPLPRIKNILDNVRPILVITSAEYVSTIESLGIDSDHILLIEQVHVPKVAGSHVDLLKRLDSVIDTDPLCIINTSGSTGIPKSVVMNHRSVIDFMDWVMTHLSLDGSEIIGSLSPFFFDIYTLELYLCLAKGATLVIIPEQLSIFPARLVEYLAEKSINFIFWVPTIMVNIANLELLNAFNLSCLKKILFAGEVFPTKHLNYWRRHIPNALFVNLYGPIEITVDCTYYIVDKELKDDEALPIGFPCRNTDVLILTEKDELAKVNEQGELCVRGSSLALGYWNDATKTAKAFTQNPLNKHYPELIYRTGDVVYKNERGEIMFVGRKDYQIKHLGYRIELGEIEQAALSIEAIDNACVLYDKASKEISLFFEAKEQLSVGYMRLQLSSKLPKYMLPTVFRQVKSLPRNPNGKIDRQLLYESLLGN